MAGALSHPDGSDGVHRDVLDPTGSDLEERGFKLYLVNAHLLKIVPQHIGGARARKHEERNGDSTEDRQQDIYPP